ncbi:MAG TPA: hypothetical protein VFC73_09210 [Syntrophomonadaceae bacterium]|nr:hypothetical protein [Syntrophomonadaceae bacterium]
MKIGIIEGKTLTMENPYPIILIIAPAEERWKYKWIFYANGRPF